MTSPCPQSIAPVEPFRETFGARAVRLSHLAPAFARMADGMLLTWRRALGVAEQATPEVETEFTALRASFDERFLPVFEELYASLLEQHLGASAAEVLVALENEDVQAGSPRPAARGSLLATSCTMRQNRASAPSAREAPSRASSAEGVPVMLAL